MVLMRIFRIIKRLINKIIHRDLLIRYAKRLSIGERHRPGMLWASADAIGQNSDFQIALDINTRLPFKDRSLKYIYFGHILEHMQMDVLRNTIYESYRVLMEGGEILIDVPDTEYIQELIERYVRDQEESKKFINYYENIEIEGAEFALMKKHYKEETENYDVYLTRLCSWLIDFCDPAYISHVHIPVSKETVKKNLNNISDYLRSKLPIEKANSGGHSTLITHEILTKICNEINLEVLYRPHRRTVQNRWVSVPDRKGRRFISKQFSLLKT